MERSIDIKDAIEERNGERARLSAPISHPHAYRKPALTPLGWLNLWSVLGFILFTIIFVALQR